MNTLIIYCHPHADSHNAKILSAVKEGLHAAGTDYSVIDLYGSGFEPRLSGIAYERMFISRDKTVEADVRDMQARVSRAHNLVFIYPVWWYGMPASLKGFVDRVFTQGFAYKFFKVNRLMLFCGDLASRVPGLRFFMQPHAATGMLKGKRAYIFRTYGGPAMGRRIFGHPQRQLEHAVLRFCGITKIRIHELFNVNKSVYSQAYEKRYLDRARTIATSIRNA